MLRPLPAGLLTYFFLLVDTLHAYQLNVHGSRLHSHRFDHLLRRGDLIPLNNSADVSYHADILLGDQPFQVLVDTGSSDLWVAGNVQRSNDTTQNATIIYAVGKVEGPIRTAHLQLGDLHVENQAFIQVTPSLQNREGTGVLGLGPSSGSFILPEISGLPGAPPLDRLFSENITTPNYFTVLLGRARDPTTFFSGTITIGSVLPQYDEILAAPKLPIFLEAESNSHNQHFEVQLDRDGIIGPDRKPIDLETKALLKDDGKITAVLDCGFSLPQVPRNIAEAIYSRFVGAELATVEGIGDIWVVPCEIEVNVTFVFGGHNYPMHPLDMTLEPRIFDLDNVTNSVGSLCCIGSLQPFTFDRGREPSFDFVLGMAFMRNVYTLFDYGNFVLGVNTTDNGTDPFVQMHSITDPSQAHLDFVTIRLGGVDTTGNQTLLDPPQEFSPKKTPVVYYVIAAVVVVVVVTVLMVYIVWNRRNRRKAKEREKTESQPSVST